MTESSERSGVWERKVAPRPQQVSHWAERSKQGKRAGMLDQEQEKIQGESRSDCGMERSAAKDSFSAEDGAGVCVCLNWL